MPLFSFSDTILVLMGVVQHRAARTSARTADGAAAEDSGGAAVADEGRLCGNVRADVPLGS